MKFRGLKIEKEYSSDKFKGTINFDTNNGDWIYLKVNDEFSRQLIEVCLPLFVEATSEKIEIIRKELDISEVE